MPKDKGKRKSKFKSSKGPDKSVKDKSSNGNPKKKRRTTGNAAGGSKAVDPTGTTPRSTPPSSPATSTTQ
jgi:hypothetical protein